MPSASTTKPENKAPPEALQPINDVILVVEKKVRNLEKRKGKLDLYRSRVAEGEELNLDQQEAIARYDAVVQNLEFARELQKQFLSIQAEAEKIYRKQTRMQRQDRNANEVRRMKELLQLQSILDHLGSENIRSDFLTGNHGAVVLTEGNLKQLDELYKLISPSRDGEKSYVEQMTTASKHIVNFIDSKDRNVAGTTYRALKELVDKINECGYFENLPNCETEAEVEKEDGETGKVENAETKEYESVQESSEKEEEIGNKLPEALPNEVPQSVLEPVDAKTQSESAPIAFEAAELEKETFFAAPAPAVPFSRQRPINEIVSSVQGTFNFLQDSHIDMESPHMDPAVVAARPMGGPTISHPAQQADSALSQSNYQSSILLGNEDQISQQQVMATQQSSHAQAQTLSSETTPGDTVPPPQQQLTSTTVVPSATQPQNNAPVGQQSLDGTAAYSTEQDYSHDLMTQSLQNTSQIAFGADTSGFTASSHPGMDQSVSGISSTPPGDVPPAIPLPSQSLQGSISLTQSMTDSTEASESGISQESQEKKPFSMNPNAAMFTSMYQPHNSVPQASSHMASNNNTTVNNAEDKFAQSVQQNDYQNSGYGFGRNGNGPRGGQRGGSRGGRGMSNGFPGRGNRNGPTYNGGRGGFNGRGNGRGAYQGYPPRSDYRPEGFQGFSNGFNFSKRGSGPPRGSVRGGAMRGGPPRSGMRGNNRGGFGSRPNNGPQPGSQTVQQAAA